MSLQVFRKKEKSQITWPFLPRMTNLSFLLLSIVVLFTLMTMKFKVFSHLFYGIFFQYKL